MASLAFIVHFCDKYGLSDATLHYLIDNGVTSGDIILSLKIPDIEKTNLVLGQKCMLRGAVLQYRRTRAKVDAEISKLNPVVEVPKKKKKVQSMVFDAFYDLHDRARLNKDKQMTSDQLKLMELKRRLHRKRQKSTDGLTLAERIVLQRQKGQQVDDRGNSAPPEEHHMTSYRSMTSVQSSPEVLQGYAAAPRTCLPSAVESDDESETASLSDSPAPQSKNKNPTATRSRSLANAATPARKLERRPEEGRTSNRKGNGVVVRARDRIKEKTNDKRPVEDRRLPRVSERQAGTTTAVEKRTTQKHKSQPVKKTIAELEDTLEQTLAQLDNLSVNNDDLPPGTNAGQAADDAVKRLGDDLFDKEEQALILALKQDEHNGIRGRYIDRDLVDDDLDRLISGDFS